MTDIVRAELATKRYGEVLGLNAFSTRFGPGITALIGPNGAGKSTFFRLVTGQLHVDSGRLEVLGRDPWSGRGRFADVGYCPEGNELYGHLTALEFVVLMLRLDGYDRGAAFRQAARALETVGLTEAAGRRLRAFSKGMRQRAKIAQAIAHEPSLLLLDEPLNGVDPLGRVQLLELFERLAQSGRHVIVSSHVLYEVERLTEEVVMIANGRALAEGNVHKLREAIDAYPHAIAFTTPDARALAERLAEWDHVTALEFPGPNLLNVRTRAPDRFYQDLPKLVADSGFRILSMASPDDNLESVFRLLSGGIV